MRTEMITDSDRKSARILLKREATDSEILLLRNRFSSWRSKSYFLDKVRGVIDSLCLEYDENEIYQKGSGILFSDFSFPSLGKVVNVYREKRPKDPSVRKARKETIIYLEGIGIPVLEIDRHDIKDGSYIQSLKVFLLK